MLFLWPLNFCFWFPFLPNQHNVGDDKKQPEEVSTWSLSSKMLSNNHFGWILSCSSEIIISRAEKKKPAILQDAWWNHAAVDMLSRIKVMIHRVSSEQVWESSWARFHWFHKQIVWYSSTLKRSHLYETSYRDWECCNRLNSGNKFEKKTSDMRNWSIYTTWWHLMSIILTKEEKKQQSESHP